MVYKIESERYFGKWLFEFGGNESRDTCNDIYMYGKTVCTMDQHLDFDKGCSLKETNSHTIYFWRQVFVFLGKNVKLFRSLSKC